MKLKIPLLSKILALIFASIGFIFTYYVLEMRLYGYNAPKIIQLLDTFPFITYVVFCGVGGKKLQREGFFYEPTVVTNVKSTNVFFQEEIFGPVMPIIVAKDDTEVVKLANQSSFGLGASVWTKNLQKAEKIAQELEAGFVTINGMVKSDPRLPFGGVKNSGIG